MRVINRTRDVLLADTVIMADSFIPRLVGLLGRLGLPPGWCLVLKPCRSVHTMFMSFPIDILFVNRDDRVVKMVHSMPPFRFSPIVRESCLAVELPAGTLLPTGTKEGDTIIISMG